jgi:hypothetical protein
MKAHLAAGGKLDTKNWNFLRVQYGSQAYIDDEPEICARERADALDFEAFGPCIPSRWPAHMMD